MQFVVVSSEEQKGDFIFFLICIAGFVSSVEQRGLIAYN